MFSISLLSDDQNYNQLTLKISASETLYGGQSTMSTQLIKPNYKMIHVTYLAVRIY